MPIQWTSNPQKVWPAGADGITIVPNGTSWVSGSYVELEDSVAEDSVLSGVVLRTDDTAQLELEVDIATGAAASETVIATVKGRQHPVDNNFVNVRWVFTIPVDAISAGDRISARIRVSTTGTANYYVAAQYYEKPIVGNLTVSAQPIKVIPSAAVGTVLTFFGLGPWVNTGYTQITASTSAAWVIDGFMAFLGGNDEAEVDLAIGAAASETVITTLRVDGGSGAFAIYPICLPLDAIPNGSRVSARVRGISSDNRVNFAISYREKPL